MKTIELRRHSLRGEGKGLSAEGVELAKKASSDLLDSYARVIASEKQRTQETAEAFGFSKCEVDERFSTIGLEAGDPAEAKAAQLREGRGLSILESWLAVPEAVEAIRPQAHAYWAAVLEVARDLEEGEAALIVSHGGAIEPAIMAGTGKWSLDVLGGELECCEGVRLRFEGGQLKEVDVRRLDR
ncbi:MAG: histidine phosphatase family protein [Armatimonadota bacterium]